MLRNSTTTCSTLPVKGEVQISEFARLAKNYAVRVSEIAQEKDCFARPDRNSISTCRVDNVPQSTEVFVLPDHAIAGASLARSKIDPAKISPDLR
jgi:hypothetical protein